MTLVLYCWQKHFHAAEHSLLPVLACGVALSRSTPADDFVEVVLQLMPEESSDFQTSSPSPSSSMPTKNPQLWLRDVKCRTLPTATDRGDFLPDITGDNFAADLVHCFTVARLALQPFIDDRRLVFRSPLKWEWAFKRPLRIVAHAGEREDSCYHRRTGSLKFFHVMTDEGRSYLCRGFDIVAHETGHAILDALNPTLYSAKAGQVAAFHESFADIVAVFTLVGARELSQALFDACGGDITKAFALTAVGSGVAEFRTAVAQTTVPDDSCRSSPLIHSVSPVGAHDAQESSEIIGEACNAVRNLNNKVNGYSCFRGVYSLSSLFSGFVWDVVVGIYQMLGKKSLETLQYATQFIRVLLTAVVTQDVSGRDLTFSRVADAMVARTEETSRLVALASCPFQRSSWKEESATQLDTSALRSLIEKCAVERQLDAVNLSRTRYRASRLGDF
jgi:hypothetical protein